MRLLAVVLVLALALVAGVWLLRGEDRAPDEQTAAPAAAPHAPTPTATHPLDEDAAVAEARAAGIDSAVAERADPAASERCVVTGRVLDEGGVGVPGATIHLTANSGESWTKDEPVARFGDVSATPAERTVTTDAAGRFRFECRAPTCAVQILTIAAGDWWCASRLTFRANGTGQGPALGPGERELGDLTVTTCGSARGRLLSTGGEPIGGVEAGVSGSGMRELPRPLPSAVSDANGAFLIRGIPPGEQGFEVGDDPWLELKNVAGLVTAAGVLDLGDLVLRRGHEIRVRFVEHDGRPVQRVWVICRAVADNEAVSRSTAADGTWVAYVKEEREYVLSIERSTVYERWGGPDEPLAHVRPGAAELRVELRRKPEMTFVVVDAATRAPIERFWLGLRDKPASNQTVSLPNENEPADHPGGELRMPAASTSQELFVRAPGYAPAQLDVREDTPGSTRQTVALQAESRLAGRIVLGEKPVAALVQLEREAYARDGRPAQQLMLGASSPGWRTDLSQFEGRERSHRCDESGTFEFGELSPGTYRLLITGSAGGEHWVREIRLSPPGRKDLGDVALPSGATIAGSVIMPAGASPAGLKVRLQGASDRTQELGDTGEFRLEGLAAGKYFLFWEWRDEDKTGWSSGDPRNTELVLAEGETQSVALDLRPFERASIEVRIRRNGRPLAGGDVLLNVYREGKEGSMGWLLGRTDAEGVARGRVDGSTLFSLSLPPSEGRYTDGLALCEQRRSSPGERIVVEVELHLGRIQLEFPTGFEVPESGVLALKLAPKDSKGVPITCSARARRLGDPRAFGLVWSSPQMEFDDIPAGAYEATVTVDVPKPEVPGSGERPGTLVPFQPPHTIAVVVREGEQSVIRVP